MVSLVKKNNALLAVLFVLVSVGLLSETKLQAASTKEWNEASIASATVSATAMNPFDGKGLIDGVILATAGTSGAFVELRDTVTANTSYAGVFGPFAVVYFATNTLVAGSGAAGNVHLFARPIRVLNGLSVNSSACTGTISNCYTVLFRQVSD